MRYKIDYINAISEGDADAQNGGSRISALAAARMAAHTTALVQVLAQCERLDVPVDEDGISVRQFDRLMKDRKYPLSIEDRIALKMTLNRVGLLHQ